MEIRSLTLVVTDDCNFSCSYCYKKKSPTYMDCSVFKEALVFFLPYLTKDYYLNFYGGEPLLAFDIIKKTCFLLLPENKKYQKKARYSITTNGSLINEEITQFFNENKFSVEFSFDGLAQEIHRDKGNFKRMVFNIESLLNLPDVHLEVNSVFTPESVPFLSESMKFIMDLGVSNINLSISLIKPWGKSSLMKLKQEMQKLRKILLIYYKKTNEIPVLEFRENPARGFFYCAAGQDRLAITPEGQIWGCDLFAAYFKGKENSSEYQKYFFGDLQTFVKKHNKIFPQISSNYSKLSMDNFSTPSKKCLFCMDLEKCVICPVSASFSGNPIGKIPYYACKIQEIRIYEREKFRKEIELLA